MKSVRWLSLAILFMSLVLAGCASKPPKVDLAADAAEQLQTITVVKLPPMKLGVTNLAHPGMVFGAIGGIVAAADAKSKTDALNQALAANNYVLSDAIAASLALKLKEAGYIVKVEGAGWVEEDGKYTLTKEKIPGDGPVLIVTTAVAGFIATISDDYMPTIWAMGRVLAADHATELYRGYHSTGWKPGTSDWKYVKATRTFKNFDVLMADPLATANALTEAADVIAHSMVDDLRRPNTKTAKADQ